MMRKNLRNAISSSFVSSNPEPAPLSNQKSGVTKTSRVTNYASNPPNHIFKIEMMINLVISRELKFH